jgi:hypothetical protein
MPEAIPVLEVDRTHFVVRLYENLLKIDLKGSFKNEIEEALENKPVLKETIGSVLSVFVPLHIRLSDVDSVHMDETGKLEINLPLHRNIVIPLERKDAERLEDKLNELIPKAHAGKKRQLKVDLGELKKEKESLISYLRTKLEGSVASSGTDVIVNSENLSAEELKRKVNKFIYNQELSNKYWVALEGEVVKVQKFKRHEEKSKRRKGYVPI